MLDSAKLENIVPNVRKLPKKILWGETVDKITEKNTRKHKKKGWIGWWGWIEFHSHPRLRTKLLNREHKMLMGPCLNEGCKVMSQKKLFRFLWYVGRLMGGGVEKGLSLQCLHTGSSMATQSWASPFSLSDTHRCIGCWQPSSECPEYLQKKQC